MIRFVLTFCHLKFPTSFSWSKFPDQPETLGTKLYDLLIFNFKFISAKAGLHTIRVSPSPHKNLPDSLESVPCLCIGRCTAARMILSLLYTISLLKEKQITCFMGSFRVKRNPPKSVSSLYFDDSDLIFELDQRTCATLLIAPVSCAFPDHLRQKAFSSKQVKLSDTLKEIQQLGLYVSLV